MGEMMQAPDQVYSFYLTGADDKSVPLVRGRLARLTDASAQILARHDYPDMAASLSAETMALAGCLTSLLKFEGVFTLQAKGDGAIKTLFADVTHEGHLRSYVAYDEDALAKIETHYPLVLPKMMGAGYMAFTVDQRLAGQDSDSRYQGIVELDGPHLADAASAWFKNSEQLASSVITASMKTADGWHSAALMLQQIALEGGAEADLDDGYADDIWHTAVTLMSSVKQDELLDPALSGEALINRLFHSVGAFVQPARQLSDTCRCSTKKVENMLLGLAPDQLQDMADEDGALAVDCAFCKTSRVYSLGDVDALRGAQG
ncbi:MAG: Hsp33 family molecular chaperone HslO [Candidatus Puniceispirillaceae bacterium]